MQSLMVKGKIKKIARDGDAWKVAISFPESYKPLTRNANCSGELEYSLYRIEGWTDETLDLHEVQVAAINPDTKEFKVVAGDSSLLPERVKTDILTAARDAMHDAEQRV